jgi:hypothetical protein
MKYPEDCPVFIFEGRVVTLRPACFDDGETLLFLADEIDGWIHPSAHVVPLTRAARELLAWSRQ